MLRLPIGFFSQRNAGNIAARPDLAPELGWVATSALSELLVPALTASAYVVIMLTYSPLLTAVTVGIVVANMAVFVPLWKRLEELQPISFHDDGVGQRTGGSRTGDTGPVGMAGTPGRPMGAKPSPVAG